MKRIHLIPMFILLLSLVLSNVVMAESGIIITGSASYDHGVTATYLDDSEQTTVYSILITWTDMTFCYDASENMVWDDVKHEYVLQTPGWNHNGSATISVTNHSEAPVDVEITYLPSDTDIGVTGIITDGSFTLPSAVGKDENAPDLTATALFTLSDQAPTVSDTSEPVKIGTITVTVTDASERYE